MHKVQTFRGDTWRRAWELKAPDGTPVDLSGATARLMARDSAGTVVLSASTADGSLTITPATGRIDMVVPYAATETISPGAYQYDLEVTYGGGDRQTIERAVLVVLEDITR